MNKKTKKIASIFIMALMLITISIPAIATEQVSDVNINTEVDLESDSATLSATIDDIKINAITEFNKSLRFKGNFLADKLKGTIYINQSSDETKQDTNSDTTVPNDTEGGLTIVSTSSEAPFELQVTWDNSNKDNFLYNLNFSFNKK